MDFYTEKIATMNIVEHVAVEYDYVARFSVDILSVAEDIPMVVFEIQQFQNIVHVWLFFGGFLHKLNLEWLWDFVVIHMKW